jgi:hypothetical protein
MNSRRLPALVAGVAVVALGFAALMGAPASSATSSPKVTPAPASTVTLQLPKAYTPKGTNGGTDDYRCFLMPAQTTPTDQVITGVNVIPGNKKIVHHAILYLIPESAVPDAVAQSGKDGRQGWSCFGDAGLPIGNLQNYQQDAPWLAAWAPGVPAQTFPAGTGMKWPKGSRIVLQMHYNLLAGKGTDRTKVVLKVQPDDGSLTALHTMLLLAPVELSCPKGVKGKLCNRAASVAEMVKRSNEGARQLADGLGYLCYGRSPFAHATTRCTWNAQTAMTIWGIAGHMHLLGKSISVVVGTNTNTPTRILNITRWNFDDQRARKLAKPLTIVAGTSLKVTCTYNPKLRQLLPELRKLPPRYITWGDGSSDEMCLSMVLYSNPPVPVS